MKRIITAGLIILIAGIITANWILYTPHGFYEKAFAVGSSVCHQITSHSFSNSDTQFPLCARCSGLYLGSFIGLAYYFTQGKRKAIPKRGFLLLLLFLFLAWAGDSVNSFIRDFLNRSIIYETTNMTRLVTGFGMGLVMSTALMTLFNLTVWKDGIDKPLFINLWQVAGYVFLSALAGWIMLSSNAIFFQVFAYISIVTVMIIITMLYTIFWIILFKKENSFTKWKSLGLFLIAGFAAAMLQVTLLNLLRQWVLG
ncbi:MAG: DUF2085 domain-containing protein [Pelolinea sp.]|nr:DUF2085 domain-containing protein [Pelolinea sp.]